MVEGAIPPNKITSTTTTDQKTLAPTGELSTGQKVTDITVTEAPLSDKVPQQNFRNPGGEFRHQVKEAWNTGGLGAVLQLLFSKLLFSAPTVAEHVMVDPAAEWAEYVKDVEDFPIDKEPTVLMNMYSQLSAKIHELKKPFLKPITALRRAKRFYRHRIEPFLEILQSGSRANNCHSLFLA